MSILGIRIGTLALNTVLWSFLCMTQVGNINVLAKLTKEKIPGKIIKHNTSTVIT